MFVTASVGHLAAKRFKNIPTKWRCRPPINFSKDRFAFFFSFFLLTFYQRLPQIKLNPCGNAAGTGTLDVTPSVTRRRGSQERSNVSDRRRRR
jgi:hypothetical protein